MASETFTVDLSGFFENPDHAAIVAEDAAVQAIVDEHIKPGVDYTLLDADLEPIAHIGKPRVELNLDEAVLDNSYDVDECDTEEEVDEVVLRSRAVLAILRLATPVEENSWGANPYRAYVDAMNANINGALRAKVSIREEAEQEAVFASHCTGRLNTERGIIEHGATCPIHG